MTAGDSWLRQVVTTGGYDSPYKRLTGSKKKVARMTVRHEKLALSRKKLLDAALYVIRAKGYEATTVDDICAAAELSKGSFFHHFKSKEDLALAAAEHFQPWPTASSPARLTIASVTRSTACWVTWISAKRF
jgi:DNA-binding transcriptional regulator YbjK